MSVTLFVLLCFVAIASSSRFAKKSIEVELDEADITPHTMVNIVPINGFSYWFPGWFWECATVVSLVFSISM
jgi:hypothetical protein